MPKPAKPIAEKRLKGTYRPSRAQTIDKADQLPTCPEPPATASEGAATEWRVVAPLAHALGTLTATDMRAFELLCEALATEHAARKRVDLDGLLITTTQGMKPHPAIKAMETSRHQAIKLLECFGLTPKSRANVERITPTTEYNPFKDF